MYRSLHYMECTVVLLVLVSMYVRRSRCWVKKSGAEGGREVGQWLATGGHLQHLMHLNSDTQAHTSSSPSSSSSSSLSHHHHCCLTMSPLLSLSLYYPQGATNNNQQRLREKKEREQRAKRETLLLTPFSVDCCFLFADYCSLRRSFPFPAPSVVSEPTYQLTVLT